MYARKAVQSIVKPISIARERWMYRCLARISDKLRKSAQAAAFNDICSSKLVMNVYELQTKRDEAYNAYNEVKKTILEDYNALAAALSTFEEEKSRVQRRLTSHKSVMSKTVMQICNRRVLKQARKFVDRLKQMR